MPRIPVRLSDLPTEQEPIDENIPYRTVIRAAKLSDTVDKNDNPYLTGLKFEVLEPEEFKGRNIYANYVCIPSGDNPDAGQALARLARCFHVPDQDIDSEDVGSMAAFAESLIGLEGDVMAEMNEYQGRKSPRIKDYLI